MHTKLLQILQKLFNDVGKVSNDEFITYCPLHEHRKRKLGINLNSLQFHCWIGEEGGTGITKLCNTYNFDIREFSGIDIDIQEKFKHVNSIKLPDEYKFLLDRDEYMHKLALQYLKKRHIGQEMIVKYKIGFCSNGKYANRIIIPSFNDFGNLNYFIARTIMVNNQSYLNPGVSKSNIIFNELYVDFNKPIYLCEGVFDAFACGDNAIPLLGSNIKSSELLFKLSHCPVVFLVLDPDTYYNSKGDSKLFHICQSLIDFDVDAQFVDIRPFDDVAIMGGDILKSRVSQSQKINNDFLLKIRCHAI